MSTRRVGGRNQVPFVCSLSEVSLCCLPCFVFFAAVVVSTSFRSHIRSISQAMEATLSGAVVLTKVLLPTMLDRKGGHVVVVGGDAPLSPPPKVISGAPHCCSTPGSCFFFWSFWTLNFGGFLG